MVNLNLEKYGRMLINGTEVSEYRKGNDRFERAVSLDTTKAALVSFYNSRIAVNLLNEDETKVSTLNEAKAVTKPTYAGVNQGATWVVGNNANFGTHAFGIVIPCKAGETYTVKVFNVGALGSSGRHYYAEMDASGVVTKGNASYNTNGETITAVNTGFLCLQFAVNTTQEAIENARFMIVKGATVPTVHYPHFSPTEVLPHLKAFGAHSKHKAPKLWGQYVPCDGIESKNRQYIDTGIIADNNTEVELDYAIYSDGSVYIFGTRIGGLQYFTISGSQTGGTNTNFVNGNSVNVDVGNRVAGTWNRLYQKVSTNNGTVNWSATNKDTNVSNSGTYSATIPTLTTTIRLFSNSTDYETHGRIYSCKLRQNGVLVRDFVPVKDVANNVYGMFDRVNEKFYGNSGTGTITGGSLIQPIAYAESDGTAHCNTDIIPKTYDYTITYEGAIKKLTGGPNCAWGFMGSVGGNIPRWACATWNSYWLLNANETASISETADVNNHTFVAKVYDNDGTPYWSSNIDGVKKQNKTLASKSDWLTNTLSIYLFARHNADGVGNYASATLKRWICEKNGVVIRNYLPVRVDTTVELLDLVEWKFATRTGTLTAGADIPYSQLCPDIIEVNTGDLQYGLYSANMFDTTAVKAGYYLNSRGAEVADAAWNISDYMPVVGGEIYYQTINTPGQSSRTCWYDANKTFISASEQHNGTQTAPSNAVYCRMCVWKNDLNIAMFTKGSTAPTEYEPYKFGLHTDGQHKLIVRGVNLLNDANVVNAYDADGNYVYHGYFTGSTATLYNQYTPSEKYRVAHLVVPAGTYSFYSDVPDLHPLRISVGSEVTAKTVMPVTITTTKTTEIQVCWRNDAATEFSGEHSMIVEGSVTPTVYQPYIPTIIRTIPTLYSEDSFCDTQLDTNNVSEAWKVLVLDGTEAWVWAADTNRLRINVEGVDGSSVLNLLCTDYEAAGTSSASITHGVNLGSGGALYLKDMTNISDLASGKAFLASKFASGNPVMLLVPLATPAISSAAVESVELTTKANRTVTAEAELAVKSQATYLGKG